MKYVRAKGERGVFAGERDRHFDEKVADPVGVELMRVAGLEIPTNEPRGKPAGCVEVAATATPWKARGSKHKAEVGILRALRLRGGARYEEGQEGGPHLGSC